MITKKNYKKKIPTTSTQNDDGLKKQNKNLTEPKGDLNKKKKLFHYVARFHKNIFILFISFGYASNKQF